MGATLTVHLLWHWDWMLDIGKRYFKRLFQRRAFLDDAVTEFRKFQRFGRLFAFLIPDIDKW